MNIMKRVIACSCGEWEEFGADEPRHHSQNFTHIENVDSEAKYECSCGKIVLSHCEEDKELL